MNVAKLTRRRSRESTRALARLAAAAVALTVVAGFSRTEVQHAVWDLQSPLLQNADLSTALRRIAGEISAGDQPLVTVEITGQSRPLASAVEHHLLRIGQEAITNAVKHAHPKKIQVQLDYGVASVTLSVRDDGQGFEPKTVVAGGDHFGLQGLQTRARKLNATFKISSEPGHGTRIELVMPLTISEGKANTPIF